MTQGLLHSLAGSAALPSTVGGLVYILVFGIGSTAGMLLVGGLMGRSFALTARHSARLQAVVQALAVATSLALGLTFMRSQAGA